MLRVVSQAGFDIIADLRAEVAEPAIEVLPALQLVTAQRRVHQHLFQANRVGDRHHDDFTQQAAGVFQLGQTLFQVPGDQHARQFVSVQRGLDVDLAGALLRAVMKAVDVPASAWHRRQQVMCVMAHVQS